MLTAEKAWKIGQSLTILYQYQKHVNPSFIDWNCKKTTYATFLLNTCLVSAVLEGQSGVNNISNFNVSPMSYLHKKAFKGQCQEILHCRFFHESSSTKPPKITFGSFKIFLKIRNWRCTSARARYQWHR